MIHFIVYVFIFCLLDHQARGCTAPATEDASYGTCACPAPCPCRDSQPCPCPTYAARDGAPPSQRYKLRGIISRFQLPNGARVFDIGEKVNISYANSDCNLPQCLGKLLEGTAHVEGTIPSGRGGPFISSTDELNCADFDSSCRWRNEPGYNGHPELDEFEFVRGVGSPDQNMGNIIFGTTVVPTGKWAAAGSAEKSGGREAALFVSDTVPCQARESILGFRYWLTPNTILRICTRRPDSGKDYDFCTDPVPGQNPGVANITIPGPLYEFFEIVLEASNFDYYDDDEGRHSGGGVIIDDITYSGLICDPTQILASNELAASSQSDLAPLSSSFGGESNHQGYIPVQEKGRIVPSDKDSCTSVKCSFNDGESCTRSILAAGWEIRNGPAFDIHTGIKQPYRPNDAYALATGPAMKTYRTGPFLIEQQYMVQFCMYSSASQAFLTVNLIRGSNQKVPVYSSEGMGLHQWICEQRAISPGGYEAIEFSVQNLRNRYSHFALDEIVLVNGEGRRIC